MCVRVLTGVWTCVGGAQPLHGSRERGKTEREYSHQDALGTHAAGFRATQQEEVLSQHCPVPPLLHSQNHRRGRDHIH